MKVTKFKVLLDTNIIIDILSKRLNSGDSIEFLKYHKKRFYGYLCSKQISDIYYVLKRYIKSKETRKKYIKNIISAFKIIEFNKTDIKKALLIKGVDFEDDLLIAVSNKSKLDFIITNNIKDFKHSKRIKAIMPYQFLKTNILN